MRFSEFKLSSLSAFQVFVKLPRGGTIKTLVFAQSPAWARLLAAQMYGDQNIISVIQDVQEQGKAPSAEQVRIKSLENQAKRFRDLAQQARAQNSLQAAQKKLLSLRTKSSPE